MPRPNLYTPELAENFCVAIATTHKSKRTVCTDMELPYSTITHWLSPANAGYIPEFHAMYLAAREMKAELLADEMLEIADSATAETVVVDKLRIDVRKWLYIQMRLHLNEATPEAENDLPHIREVFCIGGQEYTL